MPPSTLLAAALALALLAPGTALAQGSVLRDPGYGAQGYGTPGYGNPVPPGYGAPGYGSPGYGSPGYGAPGYGPAPRGYGAPGYRPPPYQEQQGGRTNYYGADGRLLGSTERSAGGGVLRSYDAEGRYLGRRDIPRGQGMPPGLNGQPQTGRPEVQVYVDPGPLLTPPPAQPQDPPPRNSTPWFGDRNRR